MEETARETEKDQKDRKKLDQHNKEFVSWVCRLLSLFSLLGLSSSTLLVHLLKCMSERAKTTKEHPEYLISVNFSLIVADLEASYYAPPPPKPPLVAC